MRARLAAAALSLAVAAPAAAHATVQPTNPSPYYGVRVGYRPATLVQGDSIMTQVYTHRLHRFNYPWEWETQPGRDVCVMPKYSDDRLLNPRPVIRAVIALGTNACAGWTKADYRLEADKFPAAKVIFVTTYRYPFKFTAAQYPDVRRQATIQATYSSWMRQIAAERPNTCVYDWRAAVLHDRHFRDWLRDGVHPNAAGEAAYEEGLRATVRSC